MYKGQQSNDGFLKTGNVVSNTIDSVGNAAELDVEEFLRIQLSDGMPVIDHIENETALSKELLSIEGYEFSELRSQFLKIKSHTTEVVTNSRLKQVYFPVSEDGYHLLSILTNSGYLFEQRKRIDQIRFSKTAQMAREHKKNNKFFEKGFSEIYGLTTIGYGGTKPANISVLNNQNAGKAHLLLSVPPEMTPRNVRNPRNDFFKDTLNPWAVKEVFEAYHRLCVVDYNNKKIRDGMQRRVQEYIDYVVHKQWQLRLFFQQELGECSENLPRYQRVWLSEQYQQEREVSDGWLEPLIKDIARSFISHYQKVIGKNKAIQLNDDVLKEIAKIVAGNKEVLR